MEYRDENNKPAPKIYLNKDRPNSRKKFTLAHEIGHYVLHKDDKVRYRIDELDYSNDTETIKLESEANYFAASLLVPADKLNKILSLSNNDYISIGGFTNSVNNGIWQVTDASPTTSAIDITKVNGDVVINESATAITVDEHPFESDGAIIVDDNSGVDISGAISGATKVFDFDYDGNIQGGRTAATDAAIVIVAIGLETAQYVTAVGTITRATGISFNIVSGLERNYSNP